MTPARLHGIADRLCLAASPIFAVMAVATALSPPSDMLCMAARDGLHLGGLLGGLLGGMVPMYILMSALHAGPWLRLMSATRRCVVTNTSRG